MPKPRTAAGYNPTQAQHVKATCLYVATKLGDLVDEVVVIGGLVPSLIVEQRSATTRHTGTLDLDVGLALGLLDHSRYQEVAERLRAAGFERDTNELGSAASLFLADAVRFGTGGLNPNRDYEV